MFSRVRDLIPNATGRLAAGGCALVTAGVLLGLHAQSQQREVVLSQAAAAQRVAEPVASACATNTAVRKALATTCPKASAVARHPVLSAAGTPASVVTLPLPVTSTTTLPPHTVTAVETSSVTVSGVGATVYVTDTTTDTTTDTATVTETETRTAPGSTETTTAPGSTTTVTKTCGLLSGCP